MQSARIIDGKAVAERLRNHLKEEITSTQASKGTTSKPVLAVIIVGARPDSQTYVRMKGKACEEVGITSLIRELPDTVSQGELIAVVHEFNSMSEVNGILVQLPLPPHIVEKDVTVAISPEKDVDGLHPVNMGRLFLRGFEPDFEPCTPKGCMELLRAYDVPIAGANAVVLGRSNIVGLPIAALLRKADATVTICHSQTRDIPAHTRNADIIIAAIGKAKFLTREMIKPGCVILDVGINAVPNPTNPARNKLVGDVDFDGCKEVASAITPVPELAEILSLRMALSNMLGTRHMTDTRKQRFSPDHIDPQFARRAAQSQHMHRPLTETDTFMPKLRPGIGRQPGITSAYGSRQRLIGLTELKDSLSFPTKIRPQTIFHDKEQLFEETISLKTENNQLKMMNVRLGTKLSQLEQELQKKDQLLQQLSGLTEEKQFSSIVLESHLVSSLKQTIRTLRTDLSQKEDACDKLRKSMKMTKITELEAEAQEYFAECQRLKEIIKDSGGSDTAKSKPVVAESKLARENQELTNALRDSRKEAAGMTERMREMEEIAKISRGKDSQMKGLIVEIATCKEKLRTAERELEERKIAVREAEEAAAMTAEDGNTQITRFAEGNEARLREIEEFYRMQIDNLEIDKGDLIRVMRETSLRVVKRKVMKKRLNFPDLIPVSFEFSLKDLKQSLRAGGLKVEKWQISGLSLSRPTLLRDDLLKDYDQAPTPIELQSTVMPASSYDSDTFSLTSNPFEVADASKRSSGVNPTPNSLGAMEYSLSIKPAMSHQSQPAPTLVPVEERDSETPLTPSDNRPNSASSSSSHSSSSSSPSDDAHGEVLEEVPEDEPGEEAFRLGIYTEPGGSLMPITEVRKSLSTDSMENQQFDKPAFPGAVILLNIEEDRIRKTLQHIHLRLKLLKIPSSAVADLLIPSQSSPFPHIDGLKTRLQCEPFSIRDEAEAIATAGYLVGHRTGLVDTQKQLTGVQIAVWEIGTWECISEHQEEDARKEMEETLKRLTFDDFKEVDSDTTGRVPLSAFHSICASKSIPLSESLMDYLELQSYAETRELGLFPYSKFLKPYHPAPTPISLDSDSMARECAQYIGTELLVQGLTISAAFDLHGEATISQDQFRAKVSNLGLEDLEGVEEFVSAVTGEGGMVEVNEVVRFLGQFSLEEE